MAYAIYQSLFTSTLIGGTHFTGLGNYGKILTDGAFWGGVVRVIIFAAIQIPVMLFLSIFFASIFDLGIVKLNRTFRTIFFLPFAVPAVVAAVMWAFLLEPQFGPFTHLFNGLGIHNVNFYGPGSLLGSIIVIAVWEWTGYNMVILYTALRSVPRDVVEAAIIDGASVWRVITRVKLPIIRPAITLVIFINSVGALQLFTEPFILNQFQNGAVSGGYTPTYYIFNTAVSANQYNLAAAGAVVLGIVIFAISGVSLIYRLRKGEL
jgi:multiple sugar transport system permease protein